MEDQNYESKVLKELLSDDEISQIPIDICIKLDNYFQEKFNEFLTAKAVFETNRKNLDQRINQLIKHGDIQKIAFKDSQEKLTLTESYVSELHSQLNESRKELLRLRNVFQRLEKENLDLRHEKNAYADETNLLHSQIERRNTEFERLQDEFATLTTQLQSAITAKCQAYAEIEEIRSREMSINFKEKHFQQEREFLSLQINSLEEEIGKKINEFQTFRSETCAHSLVSQSRLSQCEEELKITNDSMKQLRDANTKLQHRCEELTQKLEDHRNNELTMHASYREEIVAQSRLADLYKGMCDEANSKANDYSDAVKELQNLLEHATEQYGFLESKHNDILSIHNQEILQKQEKIEELSRELHLVNDLVNNMKKEHLDKTVETLAPTAAIASKILKKGLSLTQIYTQLVETMNDLNLEKEENDRLKLQMDKILNELEEKAPLVQQQREEFESASIEIVTLTTKLEESLSENNRLQENINETKRLLHFFTKENQRLKLEQADLGRQICYLLKEIQDNQINHNDFTNECSEININNLSSSQIISKKLVTFKDIESLQENNQKLLSIVRTLSSRQEEIEKTAEQIYSDNMQDKLNRYVEQITDMQTAQDRQTKMLETLIKQRDMYKSMYDQSVHQFLDANKLDKDVFFEQNEAIASEPQFKLKHQIKELQTLNEEVEKKLIQANNDFEMYKKERTVHEQILNSEMDRLREDAEKNSNRNCQLKAQLDSANERFSLLQSNVVTYKSQIKALEEKCSNYNSTIGKHEQSLMILKDEALTAQSRLSKAEVQLENLKHEKQLLRDSEGRLLKEREVLQRERRTHAFLKADVESIKISLERIQAEGQLRMENQLDDITRECAALRRRLQEEQDRFRESSRNLERQLTTSEKRLLEEKALTERIQSELSASRSVEQNYLKKIDELDCKLKQITSNIPKPLTDDAVYKKMKDLEIQLASSQVEIKSLTDQLKASRIQCQQYCDIAESAESQLREVTEQQSKIKDEHEKSLSLANNEIISLKSKINVLENEIRKLSKDPQFDHCNHKEKLAEAEKNSEELKNLKIQLQIVKHDLQTTSSALTVAEDKYAQEMVLHSTDLQTLTKLKEEHQTISEKMTKLMEHENSSVETLITEKSFWKERENLLVNEIQELQKRIDDLNAQNILLHDQIQELSEKAASIGQKQIVANISLNSGVNTESDYRNLSEDDSKSMEQLLQLMKLVRREKDLAIAKLDILKSENMRLKSQFELTNKRLKELEESFEKERENRDINVVTTVKHSELLRKVETLNALTDSNKLLREERDLLQSKLQDLNDKFNLLSTEIIPLREKTRTLEEKNEVLNQENHSLKSEATRWRQRANSLVERANKTIPEDWRRLQTERENLSKLLTSEREIHLKRTEELNNLQIEKTRLEEQINQLQTKLNSYEDQISKTKEDTQKLIQDLDHSISESNDKARDIINLKKELNDKEASLADVKNKEIQIRKIAKKYKTQYEELSKNYDEKMRLENDQLIYSSSNKSVNDDRTLVSHDRECQLREEGRSEMKQVNIQLTSKIDELNQEISALRNDSENLKKEIESINKSSLEKEERAKQVLKGARTKIMQLTEYKKLCEKEMHELKEKLDASTNECESSINEYEARIAALKSQMESKISRLEHERLDFLTEKETLQQRIIQLQRQLAGQNNSNIGISEPPTANIKPMSARTETPLASIRPMSVVVQSRTAAVLPTTAGAPLLLVAQQSQQQLVHTTETSSPTSSHVDYQPASTSRQMLVQPQFSESAESTQREESEVLEPLNTSQSLQHEQSQQHQSQSQQLHQHQQQSQSQQHQDQIDQQQKQTEQLSVQQQPQQQQQQCQLTVALVSPRIEQQQQQSILPSEPQTIPSSSTQSVTTSHTSVGQKRPRNLDSLVSNQNEDADITLQDQISNPKVKRSRVQELIPSTSLSSTDIEYQVPTSSQRDQDEEGIDGCIEIVDCDGSMAHQTPEEDFENDPYEEIEEEEEIPYEVVVEEDNNEVEIIVEDDSASVEVLGHTQLEVSTNQQQQSEATSSAGPTGDSIPYISQSPSSAIVPVVRQSQHLLLAQHSYEDGGDDCIVPSTPTLFMPRRNDGFGEAVNSPQVLQSRFTFGDSSSSSSTLISATQIHSTPTNVRAVFSSTITDLALVVHEGMDDTKMDLTQLDDETGRSVPTTPQHISPSVEQLHMIADETMEVHKTSTSISSETDITHSSRTSKNNSLSIQVHSNEPQEETEEVITESTTPISTNKSVNCECDKKTELTDVSGSADGNREINVQSEPTERILDENPNSEFKEDSREAEASPSTKNKNSIIITATTEESALTTRGATARRSARTSFRTSRGTRPTPIIWENQSSSRGQNTLRGHVARGSANEGQRIRGARGRRMRSKYYNY